jgi:hypothetical protein
MKLILVAFILALIIGVGVCNATLLDLGEYLISTGSYDVVPNFSYGSRNVENGTYSGIVTIGDSDRKTDVMLFLSESNNSFELNSSEPSYVKNPYPGNIYINDGLGFYAGQVNENLQLTVSGSNYQLVINLLKNLKVISTEDYKTELLDSLK